MQSDPGFVDDVRNNTYYLGVPTIRQELVWQWRKDWLCDVVILRSDADADWSGKPIEPVCLTMVAQLSSDRFFMDADGDWADPAMPARDFSQLCLTAQAVAASPQHGGALGADFPCVLENIDFLATQVARSSYRNGRTLQSSGSEQTQSIEIQHRLFDNKDVYELYADPPMKSAIETWPFRSMQARDASAQIVDTHDLYPIPAYDVDGLLIDPADYGRKLKGAVVYMTIILMHWQGHKCEPPDLLGVSNVHGDDVYVADVQHLRVLVPPSLTAN